MSTEPPRPGESGDPGITGASPEPSTGVEHPGSSTPVSSDAPAGRAADPTTAWRAEITAEEADRAARQYWEAEADTYQAEHGAFLAAQRQPVVDSGPSTDRSDYQHGDVPAGAGFVWGPEGVTEGDLAMLGPLGDLAGRRVLEVGCGAAQCSAWLAQRRIHAVGVDISINQLRHAAGVVDPRGPRSGASRDVPGTRPRTSPESGDALRQEQPPATRFLDRCGGEIAAVGPVPNDDPPRPMHLVAATATALPFGDATFDAAFASYGAVQFVADLGRLLGEVSRVLVRGGRWVFSVTHPIRWAFPDEPGPEGLSVSGSYFDRTPYVERDSSGTVAYAEFHRTLGDYVDALIATGFTIERVVEPEWPDWNESTWGGWSPLRGMHLPGTLIIGCRAGAG